MGHPLLWMVVNLNLLTSGSTKKMPDCNLSKIDKRLSGSHSRQARLLVNRNNQVRDYLNKTARLIIDHCIAQKIERVIVGFNFTRSEVSFHRFVSVTACSTLNRKNRIQAWLVLWMVTICPSTMPANQQVTNFQASVLSADCIRLGKDI